MKKITFTIIAFYLLQSVAHANSLEFSQSIEEEIQRQLDNPELLVAQSKKRRSRPKRSSKISSPSSSRSGGIDLLTKANKLAVDKQYEESSKLLFSLTRSSRY